MQTPIISRLVLSLLFLCFALTATVTAGPGPQQTFTPVKTMEEAARIRPGEAIAFACGNCGNISVTVADQDRGYLRSHTCATCKKKFVVRQDPHGHSQGEFIYEDPQHHSATLYRQGR